MTSDEIEAGADIILTILATIGGLGIVFGLLGVLADWLEKRWPRN